MGLCILSESDLVGSGTGGIRMDINIDLAMDNINIVIGRAVSSLIASGKNVEKNTILEQLRQSERKAVDGLKRVYAEAISLVSGSAAARIN